MDPFGPNSWVLLTDFEFIWRGHTRGVTYGPISCILEDMLALISGLFATARREGWGKGKEGGRGEGGFEKGWSGGTGLFRVRLPAPSPPFLLFLPLSFPLYSCLPLPTRKAIVRNNDYCRPSTRLMLLILVIQQACHRSHVHAAK